MTALVFDTETTGVIEPVIVEAAWLALGDDPRAITTDAAFCQRYNPGKPIALGALATHHIMDEDLADCPPAADFALPEGVQYLIGHNIDFDWNVIGKPNVKRICTLALARRAWPDLDSHTQSALLYHLDRANARETLRGAHSAAVDIRICLRILEQTLFMFGRPATWEDAWVISEHARIPRVMTFGKHKGTPIADIPGDYKAWLLRQPEVDPYLAQALRA
ncbi:3'-5' exonuclease [Achromobacter xylosoxidans]